MGADIHMRYLLTILTILFISGTCTAQNVVPNPSFETDTACPYAYNQIYFCDDWTTGNEGTPDFYSACDTSSSHGSLFAIPANLMGYQAAFSGSGYAGIFGYSESPVPDYHEYLMVKIPALTPGVAYHISMEISLADSSGYESDGLGILFNTSGSYLGVTTIPIAPQMDFSSFGVITNTTGWTRLSGTYTPDSAYTFMIIGVFRDSGQLFKIPIKEPPLFYGFSYYYIDSIIVKKIINAGVPVYTYPANAGIYPNPLFSGYATFTFDNPLQLPHSLLLYNTLGQVVKRWDDITSASLNIERYGLPGGLYYYRLLNETGEVATGKIVIGD
jgi:hypothetical protein